MNCVRLYFYRVCLLIVCFFYCSVTNAYDFQVDGLYYEIITGTNEVFIHPANGKIQMKYSGNITVPEKVTDYIGNVYTVVGIGEYAFSGSSITSISLPQTIRFIDEAAFMQCKSLKSLDLPNKLKSIGKAFISNSGITHIKIPNSVTEIANSAFGPDVNSAGCQLESVDLSELSSSITELPEEVFWSCKLKTIEIPATITSIGKGAFMSCDKLEIIKMPNSILSIKEQAFYGCSNMVSLTIPNSVSSIGNYAFGGCSSLNEVISEIKEPFSISENVFYGISLNANLQVPQGTKMKYETFTGWTKYFKEILESTTITTYSLSIKATGNGSATYDDITIKNNTQAFTINEGTSATIKFTPDNGYRIKSVKVNDTDVTSSVSNNFYTINNISANTTLEVKFEALPPTTYTISIKATGNGSASYNGSTIKNQTSTFTVNEGTLATISFSPDSGYKIKSVKVNDTDVTSSVSSNSYTISNITSNTILEVEFEVITYTLTLKAIGNGSITYNETTFRNETKTFTIQEGTYVEGLFTPDDGYRVGKIISNGKQATGDVSAFKKFRINSMDKDYEFIIEFEAIPVKTYSLSVTSSGNGSANINNTSVRNKTEVLTINEGASATVSFTPDDGYKIKSVKVNGVDVTSSVTNNQYTISNITADTSVEVEFEVITYTLSIKAIGYGSVSYDGTTIKNNTSTFTINHGTSATISLSPDDSYRIKSVKVNGTDVTSSIKDSQYTISSITSDTSLEVEFAIITYTLSIKSTGNGSASYGGTIIKNKTSTFIVNHGASAMISFNPDDGYKIKSVKVDGADVTSSIEDNQYTISSITTDTSLEVEFEVITYILSIKATGNGFASYNGTAIKGKTSTFTVNHGTSATISFSPDDGYRIKSVKVNGVNVTSNVANNSYTISSITTDTSVEVEFEVITYTLSIKATGNGSASYDGTTIKDKASTFTVNHGASATITFSLEDGYRIKFVKVNEVDVSSSVVDNQYTISNITAETSLNVEFEAIPPTTYTLSIKATGNGSATYAKTVIRDKESTFTVNEGSLVSITITPDNGYRIKRVIENETNVTSYVSNGTYIINSISRNTNVEVEFEAIPPTTYTLSIKATGNGVASYDGATIKNQTSTFTINEGASATISFSPDNGNRIKSVKVNDSDITSSVSSNSYTINKISANTTLEVEFEAIPMTTYTLSIKAIGNGSVSFDGAAIKNQTSTFTLNEGASATISFRPDNGYRIKFVKVNDTDVTSGVSDNSYTISNISTNTTLEVEFEEIPILTYTLSIKATGNGSVLYKGNAVKGKTYVFTVNHGTSATISFTPDDGNKIKSVQVNGVDVISSITDNQYTINNITADTSLEVEFEAIPPTTYTLTIKTTGNGSASYDGTSVRNSTMGFSVNEGLSATIYFSPDNGNSLSVVKVNGEDVTSQISGNLYSISNITADMTMDVVFVEDLTALTIDGVNYKVVSQSDRTINVVGGNYGHVLIVPGTVTSEGRTWTIVGIETNALNGNAELAAIIWNPEVEFKATVSNPNLLLYVKAEQYAPTSIQNVVVNGVAGKIVLKEAGSGNTFYCPQTFTAQQISYTHYYQMQTGVGESRGWETIALPFDVQTITHETKGGIVPFASWKRGDNTKPFWLYELTGSGFEETNSIKANTPYIISMPNHPQYDSQWWLNGNVTFAASEVSVAKSEDLNEPIFQDRTFVPCFTDKASDAGVYALNVNNEFEKNNSGMTEGSKFVLNMRRVHPFEAYMTSSSSAHYAIDIFEDMTTGIRILEEERRMSEENTYDLQGQRVAVPNKRGVYIVNGKKQIIK